ncbi:unnamed protein product [Effrenium voratum]|nr:unnamed protein product [Effrenium voratum]
MFDFAQQIRDFDYGLLPTAVDAENYALVLTIGVARMLAGGVAAAVLTYAGILLLAWVGFWDVQRHEDVDLEEKVMTWKQVDVSKKEKNSDFTGPRLECPVDMSRFEMSNFIMDPKDKPLLHMLMAMVSILVPMAALVYILFIHANFYVACAYGFGVFQFVRINFFMHGMLHFRHFTSHRPLFQSRLLRLLPSIFLDPIMGIPPLVFLLHHPLMHHLQNNGPYDISSTEQYDRDSWFALANYWFRFQIGAYIELPYYAARTGKCAWFFATVTVIGGFFFLLQHMAERYSGWATFCVFGMPWLLDHATDAVRNWCQHVFVAQQSHVPMETFFERNCALAYNLVDSLENRTQYNEGYHVIHHAFPKCHWSENPDTFYKKVEELSRYEKDLWLLTFINSSIWEVWCHVASNKLPQLVKNHFVHIPTAARPDPPTIGEVVKELKARLHRVDQVAEKVDSQVALMTP